MKYKIVKEYITMYDVNIYWIYTKPRFWFWGRVTVFENHKKALKYIEGLRRETVPDEIVEEGII
tara:strand:- start:400 stop:591 length:192 start_codon:yes stop_codon:yes gene_type:complete